MIRRKDKTRNVLLTERLVSLGLSIKEIAFELDVTPRQVYRYLKEIEVADNDISCPS